MIIKVNITEETNAVIESGKKAVGQVYLDKATGKLVFRKFNRSARKKDILVAELESGSVRESATRMKFFSSVKKSIGAKKICEAMSRDLKAGMKAIEAYMGVNS